MWNEICPHSRQRIFHICGANISQRSYFTCPKGKFRWKKHLLTQVLFSGGGWWIRTTEVSDNRFTVCPLWPLGNSPIKYGAGERSRTINLLITNQLLCHWATPALNSVTPSQRYRLYHSLKCLSIPFLKKIKKTLLFFIGAKIGRKEGIILRKSVDNQQCDMILFTCRAYVK